ncbi:putative signal transducing protein [Endozoicomonas arenosclerae]|uniref:putative signal transducing protein n=1 Tax=Endozoicomonas arenosclerae TaxID=1633495 RepID=UPI0007823A93|nr:DUF2007 domain-containing protein [Endozoicomonas arenosclerae]
MKLLRQFQSEVDAEELSERLRKKGILTHVSSQQSRSVSSLYTGAFKTGVWVVLQAQYQDAFALLQSNQHKVEHPLSEEEIAGLELSAKDAFSSSIGSMLNKGLAYLVGGLLAVFTYRRKGLIYQQFLDH